MLDKFNSPNYELITFPVVVDDMDMLAYGVRNKITAVIEFSAFMLPDSIQALLELEKSMAAASKEFAKTFSPMTVVPKTLN